MLDKGQSLKCSGDECRRSHLLPTARTPSIELNSEEYGGSYETNTPASRKAVNATSSCTRALSKIRTQRSG